MSDTKKPQMTLGELNEAAHNVNERTAKLVDNLPYLKNASDQANVAVGLLHDTKYWGRKAYDTAHNTLSLGWFNVLLSFILIVMVGFSLHYTNELRKQVGIIQTQTERTSGAGSQNPSCPCGVPPKP